MRFVYRRIPSLPRLAWCAVMRRGSSDVEIDHGPWVETRDGFFVEGAWPGAFSAGAFDRSSLLMGSGARLADDRVRFCCSCQMLERLHLVAHADKLIISPSLTFALARSNSHLDMTHIPYQVDLLYMLYRMANHIGAIPLANGRHMQIVHYRNIDIDRDLSIRMQHKPDSRDFESFADYKGFLCDNLAAVFRNAADGERSIRYEPVASLSSGFDSAACAALANEVGCRDAMTFRTARPEQCLSGDINDSGRPIAETLGMDVREYDRTDYLRKDGMPEAEFVAWGDLGQDLQFSAMEDNLERRILITGWHGDGMWSVHKEELDRDIPRPEAGGCCLVEFRLRVGFILLPVAFFGCRSRASVNAISRSDEMAPWRSGGKYDRPIPRRIVAERGVRRDMQTSRKKAISVLLNRNERIRSQMKPESLDSFEAFYRRHCSERPRVTQIFYAAMFTLYRVFYSVLSIGNRALSRLHVPLSLPHPLPERFSQPPGRPSFLVHWGSAVIRPRYNVPDEPMTETEANSNAPRA